MWIKKFSRARGLVDDRLLNNVDEAKIPAKT